MILNAGIVITNIFTIEQLERMKIRVVNFSDKYYDFVFYRIKNWWNVSENRANQYVASYLTNENFSKCFVALADNKSVGMGMFAVENDVGVDVTPWVMGLWVDPKYRGHGIGQRITKARFKHAKSLGYNHVYLDTQSAYGYHEKFGWIDTGIVAKYQGEESVVMIHGL